MLKKEKDLQQQLDQLKADNEELKKCYKNNLALLDFEETNTTKLVNKVMKLEKTLTEIKPILEFYANSKMGVDKGNGIFEIEVYNDNIGKLVYCYDTNPAKKALQKIKECEVENEQ
jgi:hypothetical protein